jgi:hypothetical protein
MSRKPRFVAAEAFLATLSPSERKAAAAKAAAIIAEEVTLRDLRKARDMTQAEIGAALKIGQDQVSRLEQRTDMLLSTLRNYVTSLGGDMHVLVEFPDRPPVKLASLADVFESKEMATRKGKRGRRRAA